MGNPNLGETPQEIQALQKRLLELEQALQERDAELLQCQREMGRMSSTHESEGPGKGELFKKIRILNRAIEQSPASIVITDTEGRIEYVNPKFEQLTGYTLSEVVGQTPRILKSGRMDEAAYRLMWEAIKAGREWHGEFLNKKKNGDHYWELASINPIVDPDGQVTHFVAVKEDITERRKIEEALQEKNQELEASRTQALEATRAKSAFLASMSHEIRTPLNGVLGMAELLLETQLDAEQRDYVSAVLRSGEGLLTVLNDILDFSKIEAGHFELDQVPVDLASLLYDLVELFRPRLSGSHIEILVDIDPHFPLSCLGDPARLRQIFSNLLSNAVKFTHQGHVALSLELLPSSSNQVALEVSVQDTGIGIPATRLKDLFQPFSQVDSSMSRGQGGTGLGLMICKRLVEAMGGSISVDSTEQLGSTFRVRLELPAAPQSTVEPGFPTSLSGRSILVVDDSAPQRRILWRQLSRVGIAITETGSGTAALSLLYEALAEKRHFDLVLVDSHMPGMDGELMGRTLRMDPHFNATALVLYASLGRLGDGEKLRQIGFDGYLVKPAPTAQLLQVLASVLAQRDRVEKILVTRHSVAEAQTEHLLSPPSTTPFRVLLVEDNEVNQRVAQRMMERLGTQVTLAPNGFSALEAYQAGRFDLILMDCQMPGMDGYQVTAAIREQEQTNQTGSDSEPRKYHVPIVAMTAHAMSGDRERCLEAGMDDYLAKPISLAELRKVLAHHLGGGKQPEILLSSPPTARIDYSRLQEMNEFFSRSAEEFYEFLLEPFISFGLEKLAQIRKGIQEKDEKGVEIGAHSLKGSAINLGLVGIADHSDALVRLARTHRLNEASEDFDKLFQEFTAASEELRNLHQGRASESL